MTPVICPGWQKWPVCCCPQLSKLCSLQMLSSLGGGNCVYFWCTLIVLTRNSQHIDEMGSIYSRLEVEMFSEPDKRWPCQGRHLTQRVHSVAQKGSRPPESCSHLSVFAFATLSLELEQGNVFLASIQEKTSPKPGGMFQPNLGRHISVTVFALKFVSEENFFFLIHGCY